MEAYSVYLMVIPGIASIAAIVIFMQWVRPWLRGCVGAWLGVRLRDGIGGHWQAQDETPWATGCLVSLIDGALLLIGTIGPPVVIYLPFFLLLEGLTR